MKDNWAEAAKVLDKIDPLPFCGISIRSKKRSYHISPFKQISISGVGPVFFLNKNDQKIYTALQRRFQDNFQWLTPGGYVEVPSDHDSKNKLNNLPDFSKLKEIAMKNVHQEKDDPDFWQKIKRDLDDPEGIKKIFTKRKIKWPKDLDINLQSAWQREVFEETGIDLNKFPKKIIVQPQNHRTLLIGAEPDRLTNIDSAFAAYLGELDESPKIKEDKETEEVKWISIDQIIFNKKKKRYCFDEYSINSYSLSLLETSLYLIICKQIENTSKVTNPVTKQKISRFNNPQNLQSFLIDKTASIKPEKISNIEQFLSWKFGVLDIGTGLCGKHGSKIYQLSNLIAKFIKTHDVRTVKDLRDLEKLLS